MSLLDLDNSKKRESKKSDARNERADSSVSARKKRPLYRVDERGMLSLDIGEFLLRKAYK